MFVALVCRKTSSEKLIKMGTITIKKQQHEPEIVKYVYILILRYDKVW